MSTAKFDKPSVRELRLAMDRALEQVGRDFGIKISTGNATFSADEVTFKVKGNTIGDDGTIRTKEANAWELRKASLGLDHLSIGDSVQLQGKTFTIEGYNTRARSNPVNITDDTGRTYKCSVQLLKQYN
jgi:hypothetical protein